MSDVRCRMKDEHGKVYGDWLVGERVPKVKGWAGVRWTVTCVRCGFGRWLYGFTLRGPKCPRCMRCASQPVDQLAGRDTEDASQAQERAQLRIEDAALELLVVARAGLRAERHVQLREPRLITQVPASLREAPSGSGAECGHRAEVQDSGPWRNVSGDGVRRDVPGRFSVAATGVISPVKCAVRCRSHQHGAAKDKSAGKTSGVLSSKVQSGGRNGVVGE